MKNATLTNSVVQDPERLSVLDHLHLLDTPAEEAFDRLTRLASKIVDAPVSLVSLVDADRQFFKSFVGLPDPWATKRETPLSHSFCQYVVATGEPLVVEDARKNPMLKDNLAISDLNVIGYLGMPLTTTNGTPLGSFCVIDGEPRKWTQREIEIVRELALSAMTEIELRAQVIAREVVESELRERNRQYRRVYLFAQSTVKQMKSALSRHATNDELSVYLDDVQFELDKLSEDNLLRTEK